MGLYSFCLSAVLTEREKCGLVLCDALSKSKDGWRAQDVLEQRIGMTLLALGKGQEAKPVFTALKAAEAQDPVRALYWDRLIALCDNPKGLPQMSASSRRADALRAAADIRFTAEQWRTAEMTYRKALGEGIKGEDAAWCQMQRARCLAYNGDHKGALALYDKFKTDHRKSAWASDALLRAGVLCAGSMGNAKRASEYFRDTLEISPNGACAEPAFYYLATLAWWTGQWQDADRLHRAFLKKYPDTPYREEFETARLPAIKKRQSFYPETAAK